MSAQDMDTGRLLAAWLADEAPMRPPAELREDVRRATAGVRPRSAWHASLTGHHLAPLRPDGSIVTSRAPLSPWVVVLVLLAALATGVALVGTQLLRTPPDPPPPPGPNGMIAFDSGGALFLAYPDGTGARRLDIGLARNYSPTFSPDGKLLAFLAQDAEREPMRLFVGPADGSRATDLYPDLRIVGYAWEAPSWSPDSTQLVVPTLEGRSHLVVANVDGSGYRRLVDEAADRFSPAWSPAGDWILFAAIPVEGTPGDVLGIVRPDGSGARVLVRQEQVAYAFQSSRWSPTGDRIAFAVGAELAEDVAIVDLAGTVIPIASGPEQELDVAWLPNGRDVAFYRAGSGLVIAAADGSGERTVLGQVDQCYPQFSPDGRFLLAFAPGSGCTDLRLVPLDDPAAWRPVDHARAGVGMPSWQRGTP